MQFAANHPLRNLRDAGVSGAHILHHTAVTQDQHAMRHVHNFLQPMGNQDKRDAFGSEGANRMQQNIGFGFRENGGGFVKHDEFDVLAV